MKRILSLALALLMLCSLAVSASAVKIYDTSSGKLVPLTSDSFAAKDFLDTYNKVANSGAIVFDGKTYYSWWFDTCPDCHGFALFYVSGNKVLYKCLEPGCGKAGTSYEYKAPEKDKDKDKEKEETPAAPVCPTCKKSADLCFLGTEYNKKNVLADYYFCVSCRKLIELEHTRTTTELYDEDDVILCEECGRYSYFTGYFYSGKTLYARFECGKGHCTDKKVSAWTPGYDDGIYDVYTYSSKGGTSTMSGTNSAYYGSTKTITFTAEKGYKLKDVLVNGESIGAKDKFDLVIKKDTVVYGLFEKLPEEKSYTVTLTTSGSGSVSARKNGVVLSKNAKISAKGSDTLVYYFKPASGYAVADVKVDGKSVGKVASYSFSKLAANHTVDVKFAPKTTALSFVDVSDKYAKAVEYVTKAGIMGYTSKDAKGYYFSGSSKITVEAFVAALAEMSDTAGKLKSVSDRTEWALKYGLITKKTDLKDICDVQTGAMLVVTYLELVEDINDVDFVKLKNDATVKDAAIDINMVTATTYDKNRDLNRYDLAAICNLIANLEYKG